MSGASGGRLPPRKSFAQVAAAANRPVLRRDPASGAANKDENTKKDVALAGVLKPPLHTQAAAPPAKKENPQPIALPSRPAVDNTVDSTADLLAATMIDVKNSPRLPTSFDNISKKDNSDTKSIASRTTLTLDEKESLRPDDSASMQAAAEEDTFSPSESLVAASGRESDPEPFRAQLNQAILKDSNRVIMPRAQRPEGIAMPDLRAPDLPAGSMLYDPPRTVHNFVVSQAQNEDSSTPEPTPSMWVVPPDEKLMEALASPKDRLFVLKVEQDFIDFIKDPKEEYLQLPGTNSFYRMLSHKLADYYMLGHVLDDTMSSVRIFRTPHCRLPPPLIGTTPGPNNSTPPPTAQARKIMRRNRAKGSMNEPANDNLESVASSKATSDMGSGDDSKNAEKGSLTREERENRYKEARARIFKDFEVKESTEPLNETGELEPSNSSSTSGVKKNKKKPKARDDGFEARSAFDSFGRRLSENAYNQVPSNTANGAYYYTSNQHFEPSPAFPTNSHPSRMMGLEMSPEAGAMAGGNGWSFTPSHNGGYPMSAYSMGMPSYNQDYQSGASAMENAQMSPRVGSDHTPKTNPIQPLPEFASANMPRAGQNSWQQDLYSNQYMSQAYYCNGYPGDYSGFYPGPMSPVPASNSSHAFSHQNSPSYNQGAFYSNGSEPHQSFNPHSQAFVPGMRGTNGVNSSFNAKPRNMQYGSDGIGFQNQRAQAGMNNGGGVHNVPMYYGAQQSHVPQGRSKHTHNTIVHGTQTVTRPAQQGQGQAQQQSSIAKWANPAGLPAKPPQPTSNTSGYQMETPQSLPPKPIPIR